MEHVYGVYLAAYLCSLFKQCTVAQQTSWFKAIQKEHQTKVYRASPTASCVHPSARKLLCMQDEVLIAGFGRRGHAVGDIPGVRFKVWLFLLALILLSLWRL